MLARVSPFLTLYGSEMASEGIKQLQAITLARSKDNFFGFDLINLSQSLSKFELFRLSRRRASEHLIILPPKSVFT